MTDERMAAALEHASRGWHVFPCHVPKDGGCSCRNPDCSNVGKHPLWDEDDLPNGVLDATTNADLIRRWWERWPGANIGIATGAASGFFALDIDPRHNGDVELEGILLERGPLPETLEVLTGGGGTHYFFRHPGWKIRNRSGQGAIAPGVEAKGDGGYIIGPGSVHASGREYLWEASHEPGLVDLAEAPLWLLDQVKEQEQRVVPPAAVADLIGEGTRNSTLASLAGTMRNRGMEPEEIEAALQVINRRRCVPPLPNTEVSNIARSIGRYAPEHATPWRVGARSTEFTSIEPLYKILSDPPRYIATVRGQPLKLSHAELAEWKPFKTACITRLDFVPKLPFVQTENGKAVPPQTVWEDQFLAPALVDIDKRIVAAPEDASEAGAAWQSICLFLRAMRATEDREGVYDDKLVRIDNAFLFRGRVLRQYLAKNNLDTLKPNELWDVVREHGGQPIVVRTRQGTVKVWKLPEPAEMDPTNNSEVTDD